jgi:hypothetical protein
MVGSAVLKQAMADAHPDKGGTNEAFIAAGDFAFAMGHCLPTLRFGGCRRTDGARNLPITFAGICSALSGAS